MYQHKLRCPPGGKSITLITSARLGLLDLDSERQLRAETYQMLMRVVSGRPLRDRLKLGPESIVN